MASIMHCLEGTRVKLLSPEEMIASGCEVTVSEYSISARNTAYGDESWFVVYTMNDMNYIGEVGYIVDSCSWSGFELRSVGLHHKIITVPWFAVRKDEESSKNDDVSDAIAQNARDILCTIEKTVASVNNSIEELRSLLGVD